MFSFINNFISLKRSLLEWYADSSMQRKWHLLCINYMPLTAYCNNTKVYGMLSKKGGDQAVLTMQHSGSSEPVLAGRFRSVVLNTDSIFEKLRKLQAVDVRTETATVLKYLPAEDFDNLAQIIEQVFLPFSSPCGAEINRVNNLLTAIESIKTGFTDTVLQDEQVSAVAAFVREAFTTVTELLKYPEDIVDLLAYIECVYESAPIQVSMIEELSAINIKTEAFVGLETFKDHIEYDQYMFHANYALLSVFVSNLAGKEYYSPKQSIFKVLTEFVPLAMKFTGVFNPLLDVNIKGERIWDFLNKRYSLVGTSICVTNFCKMNGMTKDVDPVEYNPLDSATDEIGRIYYIACCDLDSAFKSSSQVSSLLQQTIVPKYEKWRSPSAVVFTPTLSEALVLAMLLDSSRFETSDKYLIFNKSLPDSWITYSSAEGMDATDQVEILAIKFFDNTRGIRNRGEVVSSKAHTFVEGLIAECLMDSLRNTSRVSRSAFGAMVESMNRSLDAADLEVLGEEWQ